MRRTTVAVLLAAGLALTGCSSSGGGDGKPTPAVTPSADPLVTFTRAVDGAQLESYATGIPVADELGVFPPRWCKALDGGHSVAWVLGAGNLYPMGQGWGTKKADAYQLVLLGVRAYCPKHEAAVKGELRALGAY